MILPPEKSLAFLLADNGFDVWLVSSRGTRYSRGHTSLSTSNKVKFGSYRSLACYFSGFFTLSDFFTLHLGLLAMDMG